MKYARFLSWIPLIVMFSGCDLFGPELDAALQLSYNAAAPLDSASSIHVELASGSWFEFTPNLAFTPFSPGAFTTRTFGIPSAGSLEAFVVIMHKNSRIGGIGIREEIEPGYRYGLAGLPKDAVC